MLIGISGKIGSGKDTIGKIIQMLSNKHDVDKIVLAIKNENLVANGGWQIKKFADKLKDIVCLLIGCTRKQLEDREFKDKELGEEWNIKVYFIIDQCGKKLEKFFTLKEAEEALLYWEGNLEVTGPAVIQETEQIMTPRLLLQLLGTDCGRNIIHPNIWGNALMNEYNINSNWIITDVRFPNEAQAIKDRGGILIRVNREQTTQNFHISETALDDYNNWDYAVDNNSTLDSLTTKIKNIYENIRSSN